jgi:hypothetical protein
VPQSSDPKWDEATELAGAVASLFHELKTDGVKSEIELIALPTAFGSAYGRFCHMMSGRYGSIAIEFGHGHVAVRSYCVL